MGAASMKDFWQQEASRILKAAMVRDDYNYTTLAVLLKSRGVTLTPRSLSNKINRGNFSFSFFLRCMSTMGYSEVRFQLRSPKPSKSETQAK